jgi:hypothetical protein
VRRVLRTLSPEICQLSPGLAGSGDADAGTFRSNFANVPPVLMEYRVHMRTRDEGLPRASNSHIAARGDLNEEETLGRARGQRLYLVRVFLG